MFSPTKQKLRREVKVLQQRLKRRDKKIKEFSDIIKVLKKKLDSPQTVIEKLQDNFSGFPLELLISNFKNKGNAKTKRHYSEKMKEFALTLYFYSPKAYRFLRNMDICLPNPSTLRRWISQFNCAPGLISEVFEYLKTKVAPNESLKHVSLVFDCMSIRKQLIYDHNERKQYGYVDFGGFQIESHEELASEALVFQIVSLKTNFKCVVAYFLINRIDASVLSQLIKTVILKLNEVKMVVHNVTCDGPSTNIGALKLLGCELPEKPFFKLPSIEHNICVTLDTCHMVKLCRNTLAEKESIESEDGLVKFKYIESLNRLQKSEGYKLANKLSDKHINFGNKKMDVSVAAQTISSGVADALEFLSKTSNPDFAGCEATVKFIRLIDRLFDLLNSRDPWGKHFKQPIKLTNKKFNAKFLFEAYEYLSKLKVEGISLLKHARKTFVLGFMTNIKSNLILQERLLKTYGFKYILTYKFSQDHLELFFSCIRSMGGHNDNPNVRQFQWAMRKLMFRNSVQASGSSNCKNFEPCVQEAAISFAEAKNLALGSSREEEDQINEENLIDIRNLCSEITYYQENVIYYISGFIVKRILEKVQCEACFQLVTKQDNTKPEKYMDFVSNVNMGKLLYPSQDIFKIVCFYHSALKHNTISLSTNKGKSIYSK